MNYGSWCKMTALSVKELDEYIRQTLPTLYKGDGVAVQADLELMCWGIDTDKYRVDWFWKDKLLCVYDRKSDSYKRIFASTICGNLEMLCQLDDEKRMVVYCDPQEVDKFVERLLAMRVFV